MNIFRFSCSYGRLLQLWASVAGIMGCTLPLLKKHDPGHKQKKINKNNIPVGPYVFLVTLNKKGLKISDNPKLIHHLVKLLLFMIFCCPVELKKYKKAGERPFCAF